MGIDKPEDVEACDDLTVLKAALLNWSDRRVFLAKDVVTGPKYQESMVTALDAKIARLEKRA